MCLAWNENRLEHNYHISKCLKAIKHHSMVSKTRYVKGFNQENFAYIHIEWQFQFSLRNCLLNSLRIARVASRALTAFVVFYETANLPNCRALFFLFASVAVHVCRSLCRRSWKSLLPVCCTHASDVMSHGWTIKKFRTLAICATRHAIYKYLLA